MEDGVIIEKKTVYEFEIDDQYSISYVVEDGWWKYDYVDLFTGEEFTVNVLDGEGNFVKIHENLDEEKFNKLKEYVSSKK